jgi:hypothetical protein
MKLFRIFAGGAAAVLSIALATPSAAQCWASNTVKAAKVRDLQTVLMVGALQCRTGEHDVLGHYNTFVKTHRVAISAHNDVLKSHFKRAGNVRDYDRFTTALANGRSADTVDPDFCRQTAALAREVAHASRAEVEAIADKLVATPKGVGRTCS